MTIESLQNDRIKHLIRLNSDNRFRKKSGFFVVEGQQENTRALQYGFQAEEFFICNAIFTGNAPSGKIIYVSEKVYEKIAYRESSEGIVGVFRTKDSELSAYKPADCASLIILEGIEKPGNLGAILRSCEAFGIDALIVTDGKTDFYNPNVIRSSVGCLFGMNIFSSTNEETWQFLQTNGVKVYTTIMDHDAQDLYQKNFTEKSAVIFGTEHSGLSSFWTEKGENTLIPMAGSIDSLNLSNAVAVTCYEMLRQKKQ